MDSQSSFTTAFRAIVMLCCIIFVPVVAMFGTSLPETIKKAIQHQWEVNFASSAPAKNSTGFAFAPAGNSLTPSPSTSTSSFLLATNPPESLTTSPETAFRPISLPQRTNPAPVSQPSAVVPAGYIAPVQPTAAAAPQPMMAQPMAVSSGGDQFTTLKDRLRALGATYYLLETWGNQGQFFRFYCKIAIGGSPNYERYFEATDADPLRAMSSVLEQVEAWRSTTRP